MTKFAEAIDKAAEQLTDLLRVPDCDKCRLMCAAETPCRQRRRVNTDGR